MKKTNKFLTLFLLIASLGLAACGGGHGESGGGGTVNPPSGGGDTDNPPSGGGDTTPTFTPTHAGTTADPYTISDALGLIGTMKDNEHGTATVYVKGVITSENADIIYNTKYSSATFMMGDLKAYSISGCSVTAGEKGYVAKGYEVVVGGVLIKYLDNGTVVPEVGYNSEVKNTTVLVSSTATDSAAQIFTITFNSNGGSAVSEVKVRDGALANKPANPTKSGYAFDGWYKDADLTQPFDWNSPVTGNITLYAKWFGGE